MKNDKLKIAITGGIGSGKTTATKIIQNLGYKVLSSDGIVKELYDKRSVKKLLKDIFPDAVSGTLRLKIDRQKISSIAFNDKAKHKLLTDTITPLVLKEILKRLSKINGTVFVEVPLLFECGYEKHFDDVLVITRNKADRISSVKERSNLTEEQIIARMNNQVDYDLIDLSTYTVIENNGSKDDLSKKLTAVINNLNN